MYLDVAIDSSRLSLYKKKKQRIKQDGVLKSTKENPKFNLIMNYIQKLIITL